MLVTDPVCFRRDASGDLKFPLELARGLEAVAIGCRTRLLLIAGEWFLDLFAGVRWLPSPDGRTIPEREAILGQHWDPLKARREVRRELLTVPGVVEVTQIDVAFDSSTRTLSITWAVRTEWGDTPADTLTRAI